MNPKRHEIPSNRLSKRQRATRGLEKHPALTQWIKIFLSTQPLPGPKSGRVGLSRKLSDGTWVSIKIQVYEPDPRYDSRTDWTPRDKAAFEERYRDRRNVMMPPHDHLLAEWVEAFLATGPKPRTRTDESDAAKAIRGWMFWGGRVDGRAVRVSVRPGK